MSKTYNAVKTKEWRKANPEKYQAQTIRDAYRLLLRNGIIDGKKVLTDPTKGY